MKKNISILCALVLFMSFASCGDNKESSENPISQSSETEETTSAVSEPIEAITTAIETTTITTTEQTLEPTTDTITEPITEIVSVKNSAEYVASIGNCIEITDILEMNASSIGAIDGTSFMYNGNKFEVYKFDENSSVLSSAADGDVTLNILGFGEYSTNSLVNGKYVMIYSVSDDNVSQAFMAETF